jgi:hypothetical protein
MSKKKTSEPAEVVAPATLAEPAPLPEPAEMAGSIAPAQPVEERFASAAEVFARFLPKATAAAAAVEAAKAANASAAQQAGANNAFSRDAEPR